MSTQMSAAQSAQQNNRGPGGQYSFGTHAEPEGLNLDTGRSSEELDQLSVTRLKQLAVDSAEQRKHHDLKYSHLFQRSEESHDADIKMAGEIDQLDPEVCTALMKRLRISRHAHLLNSGQKLGNDSVVVPNDMELSEEDIGQVLSTQVDFELLGLKEPAKLSEFFYGTPTYEFTRNEVTQKVIFHENGNLSFRAKLQSEDHESIMWGSSASCGGVSSYEGEPTNDRFAVAADFHLHRGLVADEAWKNERLASKYDAFKALDPTRRTVTVNAGGDEVVLDFSSPDLIIKDSDRKPLPQMVADGFIKQYAKSIRYPRGAGMMEKDLRSVFDNAAARMTQTRPGINQA